MCTFACEHLRACVRACVRVCVRAKACDVCEVIYERQRLCDMCMHVCSRIQCDVLTGAQMTFIIHAECPLISDRRLRTLLSSLMAYAIRQLYLSVQV